MGLFDVLRVFQRFWALMLLLLAVGLAVGAGSLLLVKDTYASTSRLFISTQSLGTASELLQGSTYTQARMLSYATVASDPIVLEPVIEQLGLKTTPEQLAGQVSATAQSDELIIEITAKAGNPISSSDIANAVADQLSTVIEKKIEAPVAGSDPFVKATVIKKAVPPQAPSWPTPWIFITVGGLSGLLLGIGLAFLFGALDTRVRNVTDIERSLTVPVLGMVSKDKRLHRRRPLDIIEGRNTFAESIRALRTNLQFVDAEGDERRVLLITSTVPSEGKSTTSLSLAAVLAEGGNRVALVDADLRKPSIAGLADIEGGVGVTDVLLGKVSLADALQTVGSHRRLHVLPAGRIPPNPAELLASPQFAELIAVLRRHVDYVVIDSPPVLAVSDALVLSHLADASIVVVGVERVRRQQFTTAMTALQQAKAPLAGVVMNRLARTGVDAYAYYTYGYASATNDLEDEPPAEGEGDGVLAELVDEPPTRETDGLDDDLVETGRATRRRR